MIKAKKNLYKLIALMLSFTLLLCNVNLSAFSKLNSNVSAVSNEDMFQTESTQFTPLDFTISLDYQGGEREVNDETITSDSIQITSNQQITISPPTKQGYAFYGFFTQINANGIKYFDEQGTMSEDIVFTTNTPRTLYASWVKLSSGAITTTFDNHALPTRYSDIKNVSLDITKLQALRYTKIQINFSSNANRLGLNLGENTSFEDVWNRNQKTNSLEYYSITLDITKFNNNTQFRFFINYPTLATNNYVTTYFTAIERTSITPYTVDTKLLNTVTHNLEDSANYNISNNDNTTNPLGGNYTDISLRFNGGNLIDDGSGKYGYIADDTMDSKNSASLEVLLNYNYSAIEKINNTNWNISYDTYQGSINGVSGVGSVSSGALLVQKSSDGSNWTWENPYNNSSTQSFHSTDFINNYSPEEYDGQNHNVLRYSPVEERDVDGNIIYNYNDNGDITGIKYKTDSNDKTIYQETYNTIDGYLPIYKASGDALKSGIYIRVLFAYELSYYVYNSGWEQFWDGFIVDRKVWHYVNVVEETTFYIANSKAEIILQNMDFSTSLDTDDNNDARSSDIIRQFGTVNDGDAVNDGFKVNFNGNSSYVVRYSKNGANFYNSNALVSDGQIFMEPGKYVFRVIPKVGEYKDTTIYINDKGLNQNLNYYFGDNLITSDSERLYTLTDEIPVYLTGKVSWHTNQVDNNHLPIAGRIGMFTETLSVAEFEQKYGYINDTQAMSTFNTEYFKYNAYVQVDSDYVSTPNDGFTSYRIEVAEGYTPIDGDGFIAYDEPKVDTTNNTTVIGSIYGTLETDDGRTIIGTIKGYDIYKIVASKLDNSRNAIQSSTLTEVGTYVAEFANNPKYFNINENNEINTNEVQLSGDVYTFVFQFTITDELITPSINEQNLTAILGFSDYPSKYYGVTIGYVTFAYFDYATAYNCAYEYARSLVQISNGKYYFNDLEYTTQFSVLSAIYDFATALVQEKYFDSSNSNSYLTYSGDSDDILNSNKINQNVIVFDSSINSYYNAMGLPFLNNRKYSFIDANGDIQTGINQVEFIQVTDYESSSVELINQTTGQQYFIPYGIGVQNYLESKNALTGKYKIIETNSCGTNTYYAIYIKPGDNTTSIDITRVSGANSNTQTLSKIYANTLFTVNSFIINSASNELDPYGIVKVFDKQGNVKIYQLDEVENVILDKQGEYTISLIDRLGNVVNFYVNIYSASEIHNLTLINNGEQYSSNLVSGGQRVYLDTLTSDNPIYEFIGWQDNEGNIYNGQFLFGFNKDTTLTALWHYASTTVSVYDGDLVQSYTTKAGQTLILPTNLTKSGYEFYGYKYNLDGQTRYCIGQLNSVPNVENLSLDAVWLDTNDSITVTQGENLPSRTKQGLTFYGWATQNRGANAVIITDNIADTEITASTTLYALYTSDSNEQVLPQTFVAGMTQKMEKITSSIISFLTNPANSNSILITLSLMILCGLAVFGFKKKKFAQIAIPNLSTITPNSNNVQIQTLSTNLLKENIESVQTIKEYKIQKYKLPKSRTNWKKIFTATICCILILVMSVTLNYNSLIMARDAYAQEMETTKQLDEYKAEIIAQKSEKEAQEQQQTNYITQATEYYTETKATELTNSAYSEDNESEISDEETFLYGLVFLDLSIKGYTNVFDAILTTPNGDTIYGIGYTNYEEVLDDEDKYYSGFIACLNNSTSNINEIQDGDAINEVYDDEVIYDESYEFSTEYLEQIETSHYVAFDKYCQYSIDGLNISYSSMTNDESLYNTNLGSLYDYDLERIIYEPDLGATFTPSGYSINSGLDYDMLLDSYRTIIDYQNNNAITMDTVSITAIDISAINEYVLQGQKEEFLGISTAQIQYIESCISSTTFYYIDGITGEVGVLELPEITAGDSSSTIWNIINVALSGLSIIAGILLCCTGFGVGFGVGLIVGGVIGITAQYFNDEISSFLLNTFGADTLQAVGGGFSVTMGSITIKIGAGLCKAPGWAKACGILFIILGSLLTTFGLSEISEVAFDYNFIKEWTGISDIAYSNLYQALNYASTITVIAYASVLKFNKLLQKAKTNKTSIKIDLQTSLDSEKQILRQQYLKSDLFAQAIHNSIGPKNKYWVVVENYMDDISKAINKDQFKALSGNGYIILKTDPSIRIPIKDGFPVFDEYAKATVKIDTGFSKKRSVNFKQFNGKLAEYWSKNTSLIPDEYKNWFASQGVVIDDLVEKNIKALIKNFKLTWHECEDSISAQLVPQAIHSTKFGGIPHLGGVSIVQKYKEGLKILQAIKNKGV